jgi:hypothetical protein
MDTRVPDRDVRRHSDTGHAISGISDHLYRRNFASWLQRVRQHATTARRTFVGGTVCVHVEADVGQLTAIPNMKSRCTRRDLPGEPNRRSSVRLSSRSDSGRPRWIRLCAVRRTSRSSATVRPSALSNVPEPRETSKQSDDRIGSGASRRDYALGASSGIGCFAVETLRMTISK